MENFDKRGKSLKGGSYKRGAHTNGGTSYQMGRFESLGKFFKTKLKVENIDVMGIFRHTRDAKFKIFQPRWNHAQTITSLSLF